MSPKLHAYVERLTRSAMDECLERMIFVGHISLRRPVAGRMSDYDAQRNRQGSEKRPIDAPTVVTDQSDAIHRQNGLLNIEFSIRGKRHDKVVRKSGHGGLTASVRWEARDCGGQRRQATASR